MVTRRPESVQLAGRGGTVEVRRTKIVATVGPATRSRERLRALIEAGVDVFRLNFSHGTVQEHLAVIEVLRRLEGELGVEIGILQDLCGPKIRLGRLPEGGTELRAGERVLLTPEEDARGDVIPVGYPWLVEDVGPGDPILLADGTVELEVLEDGRRRITIRK